MIEFELLHYIHHYIYISYLVY